MKDKNEFISIPKAAEKCGVDRRTMWRWVKLKKIPSFVTVGGHHRILRSDIDALLEQSGLKSAFSEKKSILVVDDDESVREILKERLTRKGYEVETAADGFSAGLKAREMTPDLMILDLIMEGMDGFEVCRTLKADSSLKDTRILIMTGFDTPENRERALREGADGYLPKGGSFETIFKHIDELLNA